MKKLDNLAAIVEDIEDLLAARMEKALRGGWTSWWNYRLRNNHTGIRAGAVVEVRFQFPGSLEMSVEVRRQVGSNLEYFNPDLSEWFFPDLENESEARRIRQVSGRLLQAF